MTNQGQDFNDVQAARLKANHERAQALHIISSMAEQGNIKGIMPWLIPQLAAHPALKQLRLTQLDAAMFGSSRKRSMLAIRKARQLADDHSTTKDGYTTIGWALASQTESKRMTAWLWVLMQREHEASFNLPDGFPFDQLYDDDTETA